jgi:hypothetical protein
MAKKPFKPVGPGGNLYVPNRDPDKDDKIMDWQNQSKEGFSEPRKPDETLHAKGGVVERFNALKMQRGGAVKKKDSDDGDEELPPGLINMPIGEKGTLSVTPEYTPSEGVGITGKYEHQFSPQTTGGVEGYAYKYHDDPNIDAGGRLYMRHKFQQGGAVEGQSCKHGSSTIVSCRNKNE